MKILVVDDEPVALSSVKRILKRRGIAAVDTTEDGQKAIERIRRHDYDIVLLDILMPGADGMQVLEKCKPYKPHTEFIMLTAVDDVQTSVKAIQLGAYDYLVKPIDPDRLNRSVQQAFERMGLKMAMLGKTSDGGGIDVPPAFNRVITGSPHMIRLLNYANVVARSGQSILITGESGTGKELIANGIHKAGPGRERSMVSVNVTAVPASLFESHFFGHRKGAFTGAERNHQGYFEQADRGTLFLDEIGDLPLQLQAKFLRVLEDKTVTPVGCTESRSFAVQVLASTNRDLEKACQDGEFRLDLFFRLASARIHLPPLRERPRDIPLLADHFLRRTRQQFERPHIDFSPESLNFLMQSDFPGNVRQLAQMVENAVLLCENNRIEPHHLGQPATPVSPFAPSLCSLKDGTERHVAYVLSQTHGDRKKAARILNISTRQLQRRIADMKKRPRWEGFLEGA